MTSTQTSAGGGSGEIEEGGDRVYPGAAGVLASSSGPGAWEDVLLSGSARVASTTLASSTMSTTEKDTGLREQKGSHPKNPYKHPWEPVFTPKTHSLFTLTFA